MNDVALMSQQAVANYGERSLTAADVRAQVNLLQDVLRSVMQKDVHYGQIPGTNSKSLYKPGAEKIMSTFRLAADPVVEDMSTSDEVHYRVMVRILSSSGQFLGAGLGECSSSEEKYNWRRPVCDEEFEAAPETRRRIKWGKYQGRPEKQKQVRTNPADVRNTVLKMAKKRSLVDAVLTVTAASDLFTQDIEDLPDELREQVVDDFRARATPAKQAAEAARQEVVDPAERDLLIERLEAICRDGGEGAFKESWNGLKPAQRKLVGVADRDRIAAMGSGPTGPTYADLIQRLRTATKADDVQQVLADCGHLPADKVAEITAACDEWSKAHD